ncbi:hypothetical protein SAMN05216419_10298 [Nitrosomonas cryotolerans]|uniref:Uncharacterized protein n=1 Tax=Nitrosomonas cryotolerans ATCC 49181 TaxID=1131553 RepID=A0A1N6JI29_9PROT|nr:hypothetical protein [Nitrosomonas cryotolerans]SFP88958.1 hypothetical protein SAMN05216419_10298 [Nitrosomonas cryotolerans]SIO43985.1 hypothetical protein SAMN02743940_2634 [Nitrosomonas cryotolerans ATCC 49181]
MQDRRYASLHIDHENIFISSVIFDNYQRQATTIKFIVSINASVTVMPDQKICNTTIHHKMMHNNTSARLTITLNKRVNVAATGISHLFYLKPDFHLLPPSLK